MSRLPIILSVMVVLSGPARGEVSPVEVSIAEAEAWTGEWVRMKIELRAAGSFSSSAGFDLPKIPGTLLLKVGNPVVSSLELEGESWFVQIHEFALFSQKSGTLTVPSFQVRFEAREGFTGPASPVVAKTEPVSIEIRRPPGSEEIPFLVTSENLTITESWDPDPGEVAEGKIGDVFRRTIVQRSSGLTGMALAPASTEAPEGVRVYEPQVETSDNTERGAFDGERRETLTYLLQKEGMLTLPALQYTWWNPKTETLEQKTLPGIEVSVAAPLNPTAGTGQSGSVASRWMIGWMLLAAGLAVFFRARLSALAKAVHQWCHPPSKVVARRLRRACRRDDAGEAERAWARWMFLHPDAEIPPSLEHEIRVLYHSRYGKDGTTPWEGKALWEAFSSAGSSGRFAGPHRDGGSSLPPLNFPTSP